MTPAREAPGGVRCPGRKVEWMSPGVAGVEGDRVSVPEDENVLEMDAGDVHSMNVLHATELYTRE